MSRVWRDNETLSIQKCTIIKIFKTNDEKKISLTYDFQQNSIEIIKIKL